MGTIWLVTVSILAGIGLGYGIHWCLNERDKSVQWKSGYDSGWDMRDRWNRETDTDHWDRIWEENYN